MTKLIELTGKKFCFLTVIKRAPEPGRVKWLCTCVCGANTAVQSGDLISGHTKSCGCLEKEARGKSSITHGMSRSREFRIWCGIRVRCNNKNNKSYKDYGGRGIKVCQRWMDSFQNFYSDMGKCPPNHSIDRIDANGGYSPDNCRWATSKAQNNNRTNNHFVTMDGTTKPIMQWIKERGISTSTVYARLARGLSDVEALTK